jgi:hypothetical protein
MVLNVEQIFSTDDIINLKEATEEVKNVEENENKEEEKKPKRKIVKK